MSFTSTSFYIFLPIAIIVFFLMPQKIRYIWLLFVSFVFYTSLDSSFATLLIVSIITTWLCGNLIYSCKSVSGKKVIMAVGLIFNLSLLAVFKYAGFTLSLFSKNVSLNLILPAGISFYTFQSLTYIFDIYNGNVKPEDNIFKYALFVSFFPLILSGPIERAKNLLPQLDFENDFDQSAAKDGLKMMLFGYFLKVVVVSRLNIMTDAVFNFYEQRNAAVIVIGIFAYALQIYCDFQGYSCIAIGMCRIMGLSIIRNFRQPYFAVSVADFWRRWHISLSTWFKDYLYIPLGGNRKGTVRKYMNLLIVFVLSGIWHGANLTFLFWGLLNGLYQIIGDLCKPIKSSLISNFKLLNKPAILRIIQSGITFILIGFTWVFFRSASISEAFNIIRTIFVPHSYTNFDGTFISNFGLGLLNLLILGFSLLVLFIIDFACEKKNCDISGLLLNTNVIIRWGIYYAAILLVIYSMNLNMTEFIYQSF